MENGFRAQARRILLQQIAPAYHRTSRTDKQQILEEFVSPIEYIRKYALWLLMNELSQQVDASFLTLPERQYKVASFLHDSVLQMSD